MVSGVEISQLQGPGQVVSLGGVPSTLVRVLEAAEQLREAHVDLKADLRGAGSGERGGRAFLYLELEGWIVNRLGYPVGVLKAVQSLVEARQFQVNRTYGQVDMSSCRTLFTLVVEGVSCICQRSRARNC